MDANYKAWAGLCLMHQVWNVNKVSSIVGVFNIQGASWDRQRRRFHIHDAQPSALWTRVRPSDVWPIAQQSPREQPAQVGDWPAQQCSDHGGGGSTGA